MLQEKLKILNDINEEILGLCDIKDIESEIEESTEIVARILNAIKNMEGFMHGKCNSQPTASSGEVNTSNTSVISENTSGSIDNTPATISIENNDSNISNVVNTDTVTTSTTAMPFTSSKTRLPKLQLTKFKGQVTKLSFESAVHNNHEISKIDKFNYLNSLLEGAALRAIQGLALTGSNYDAAIEILRDRFGQPQQIITAHMDELHKISACTGDRLTSLRFVYDKIRAHVRQPVNSNNNVRDAQ